MCPTVRTANKPNITVIQKVESAERFTSPSSLEEAEIKGRMRKQVEIKTIQVDSGITDWIALTMGYWAFLFHIKKECAYFICAYFCRVNIITNVKNTEEAQIRNNWDKYSLFSPPLKTKNAFFNQIQA